MKLRYIKYCLLLMWIVVITNCVKPYNPPALQARNNYLVVDGFINSGANQVTTINLSRTTSVSDSVFVTNPEMNASVQIASNDGNLFPLSDQGNGVYVSDVLNLDNSKSYQLKIKTSNGKTYSSETFFMFANTCNRFVKLEPAGRFECIFIYTRS